MREHHALGLARGARGVDDGRHIFSLRQGGGRCICQRFAFLQPLRQAEHAGFARLGRYIFWQINDHHRTQAGHGVFGATHALPLAQAGQHQQADFCIVKNVGNAGGVIGAVHGHRNRSNLQGRLVHAHGIYAVGQPDAHTVCMHNAAALQGTAVLHHGCPHFVPAQLLPGQVFAHRFTIGWQCGAGSNTCLQHMGQAGLLPWWRDSYAHTR